MGRRPLPPPGFKEAYATPPYRQPLKVQLTPESALSSPPSPEPNNNDNSNISSNGEEDRDNQLDKMGLLAPAYKSPMDPAHQKLSWDANPIAQAASPSPRRSGTPEEPLEIPHQTYGRIIIPDTNTMVYEILCRAEQMRWNFQVGMMLLTFIAAFLFLLTIQKNSPTLLQLTIPPHLAYQQPQHPMYGNQDYCSMHQAPFDSTRSL